MLYCIQASGLRSRPLRPNRCLIVAGEEWPHRSRNLPHFDRVLLEEEEEEEVGGWRVEREVSIKENMKGHQITARIGEGRAFILKGGWRRWVRRRIRVGIQAVATGYLIYLTSSWLRFLSTQHKKNISLLALLFFLPLSLFFPRA